MHNQFKPGDLAIIVGCTQFPQILGRCVELVTRHQRGELFFVYGAPFRPSEDAWLVSGDSVSQPLVDGGTLDGMCMIAERHLAPLRGDFQPEQQKSMVVEHG